MLRPGGKLFLTVKDRSGPGIKSSKRRMLEAAFPILPGRVINRLQMRWSSFEMSRQEVERLFRQSRFQQAEITWRVAETTTWMGAHFTWLGGHCTWLGGDYTWLGGDYTWLGGDCTWLGGYYTWLGGEYTWLGGDYM